MADTIDELYSKYTSSVEEALGDDRYFQYLFEMIQASDNKLEQTYRVLHKVVDESWLTVVEEGIEAIFNIVDKPRRFIKNSEEVVPVALAKKITADSVRHLSQNTQFIETNAAGEMQPTRILNVTTEESYDLYENRFVYHLIQRLFSFVDKRTDVIFWQTGDETCNVLNMESKIDDAYEQISYKVEMTIRNKQSLVENDADNMGVFKRIDRVRRMSRVLRTSSFCDIMNGCAKVHSPIQRTNLMMKDPNYRTCYKLWQFIEGYDEVGYSIEEQDSAMEFDEEYLLQMYINVITNYTVFKSLIESDPRKMYEIATEKKEPVRPKFVKEIKEEIVESRDIPEVEVRQVFVEEVTQAQLDAEAALEKEKQHSQELEQSLCDMQFSLSDMQWQMDSMNEQMQELSDLQAQAEEEKLACMDQLTAETKAHQETRDAMERALQEAKQTLEQTQERADAKIAQTRADAEREIAQAKENAEEETARIREEAAREIARAKEETAQTKEDAKCEIARAKEEAETDTAQARAEADRCRRNMDEALIQARDSQERETAAVQEAQQNAQTVRQEAVQQIRECRAEADAQIAGARKEAQETIEAMRREMEETIEQIRREAQEVVDDALRREEKAIARAEANSLSHYILHALQSGRERRKPTDEDEK